MKITHYTNACAVYESRGYRLLSDPWLSDSAFEGSWIHPTPLKTKPQDLLDVDALYISHLHEDHLDPETLKHFRRDIPIVTLQDEFSLCVKALKKLGFRRIHAVPDKFSVSLGPFKCTMFAPFTKHPYFESNIGNVVDSAILIRDDDKYVLNCNDNSLSLESAWWLYDNYGSINVAQINWNNASEYPCCFDNLSHDEKLDEAKKCIDRNLANLLAVSKALRAELIQPFAGDFKLCKELDHLNKYLGTTTAAEAVNYLQDNDVSAFCLNEGETFNVG